MDQSNTITGKDMPEVTKVEKLAIIVIFGLLALISIYQENYEAASGFASTIAVYFLSREGV